MKKIASVALIVILLVALISIFYFAEASVYYWDLPYQYQRIGDQWFTIDKINNITNSGTYTTVHCQNRGLFEGTFTLMVKLTNASFSGNSNQSSGLINSTETKLFYTLRSQQDVSTNVYFKVDDNSTKFTISIFLETNQFFLRSTEYNWDGQNTFPYYLSSNNTWSAAMIS